MNNKLGSRYGLHFIWILFLILAAACSNPTAEEPTVTSSVQNQYLPVKGLAMLIVDETPIRPQPSAATDEIGKLYKGDVVQLIGTSLDEDWFLVEPYGEANWGQEGWVLRQFMVAVTPGPSTASTLEFTSQPTDSSGTQTPIDDNTPSASPNSTPSSTLIPVTTPTSTTTPSPTTLQVTPPTSTLTPTPTLIRVTPPTSTPSATLTQVTPPTSTSTSTPLQIFTPTDTENPVTVVPSIPTSATPPIQVTILPPIQPPILPPGP